MLVFGGELVLEGGCGLVIFCVYDIVVLDFLEYIIVWSEFLLEYIIF